MRILFLALITLYSLQVTGVNAQTLEDQINAVDAVQKQAEKASHAAQQAQNKKNEKIRLELNEKKKQDQLYQDKLRDIDVEERQLEIEVKKARVNRVNEYIDQELKTHEALNDVIKSEADVNRNISEGAKSYLEKAGDMNKAPK